MELSEQAVHASPQAEQDTANQQQSNANHVDVSNVTVSIPRKPARVSAVSEKRRPNPRRRVYSWASRLS